MGICIKSKMIYGMRYARLTEHLSEEIIEELNESLDDGDVDYASPSYDSDRDSWIVGFELSDGFNLKTIDGFKKELSSAEKEFVKRFGVAGFVYCTPDVF